MSRELPPWLASRLPAPVPAEPNEPGPRVRALVLLRAGYACEACGAPLELARWELHHRRLRGMGGSRLPESHEPPNLLALCVSCHRYVHSHRAEAVDAGLVVHAGADPAAAAVELFDGTVVLLMPDGGYAPYGEEEGRDGPS